MCASSDGGDPPSSVFWLFSLSCLRGSASLLLVFVSVKTLVPSRIL